MVTKEANRRWLSPSRWLVLLLVVGGAVAAFAQFGGRAIPPGAATPPGTPPEQPAVDQRLFPGGLPKMESMLQSALDHHPEVLAARSKLRAAEAEVRQAELSALKDVMKVRDRWEVANRNAADRSLDADGLREKLGDLAAIEWELAFLLGTRGDLAGTSDAGDGDAKRTPPQSVVPALAVPPATIDAIIPRSERAKTTKKKLGQEMTLALEETPLTEVAAYLSEQSGVKFILDKQALEAGGFPADTPVTLKLEDVEMATALQAFEDLHDPLFFVVRDWGILVTTDSKRSFGHVSACDFWKLTDEELRDKLRQQYQDEIGSMGGLGGGYGGGMGGGGGFF